MFKGWFLINDCIRVSYKEVPVGRIKFAVEHVGIERPKFEILTRLMGDARVTVAAKGFDSGRSSTATVCSCMIF